MVARTRKNDDITEGLQYQKRPNICWTWRQAFSVGKPSSMIFRRVGWSMARAQASSTVPGNLVPQDRTSIYQAQFLDMSVSKNGYDNNDDQADLSSGIRCTLCNLHKLNQIHIPRQCSQDLWCPGESLRWVRQAQYGAGMKRWLIIMLHWHVFMRINWTSY